MIINSLMKSNSKDVNRQGIYAIKNLINNKVYIGQSVNIYRRIRQHVYLVNNRDTNLSKSTSILYNSIRKHGMSNFAYYVLEEVIDKNDLQRRESYWINELSTLNREFGYNIRIENEYTYNVSEETKQKISNSNKGKAKSESHKQHMTTSFKVGNVKSKESMDKFRNTMRNKYANGEMICHFKGKTPHNKGVKTSIETREKQRLAKLGTKQSEETIKRRFANKVINKIYHFTLKGVLINIYDSTKDCVSKNNNKYLSPGIAKCCNGGSTYYLDSIFKYEKDIILKDDIYIDTNGNTVGFTEKQLSTMIINKVRTRKTSN